MMTQSENTKLLLFFLTAKRWLMVVWEIEPGALTLEPQARESAYSFCYLPLPTKLLFITQYDGELFWCVSCPLQNLQLIQLGNLRDRMKPRSPSFSLTWLSKSPVLQQQCTKTHMAPALEMNPALAKTYSTEAIRNNNRGRAEPELTPISSTARENDFASKHF